MKIPKQINISGHFWTISIVPEKIIGRGVAGLCILEDRKILILDELNKSQTERTLLHEIKHAHQYETGLMEVLDMQALEMDCEGFASLITSLFELRFK